MFGSLKYFMLTDQNKTVKNATTTEEIKNTKLELKTIIIYSKKKRKHLKKSS